MVFPLPFERALSSQFFILFPLPYRDFPCPALHICPCWLLTSILFRSSPLLRSFRSGSFSPPGSFLYRTVSFSFPFSVASSPAIICAVPCLVLPVLFGPFPCLITCHLPSSTYPWPRPFLFLLRGPCGRPLTPGSFVCLLLSGVSFHCSSHESSWSSYRLAWSISLILSYASAFNNRSWILYISLLSKTFFLYQVHYGIISML